MAPPGPPACCALLRVPARVAVKLSLWAALLFWLGMWVLRLVACGWRPLNSALTSRMDWRAVYGAGNSVSYFVLFDAPVFAIVVLAALYLELKPPPGYRPTRSHSWPRWKSLRGGGHQQQQQKAVLVSRKVRSSMWTYPVLTGGPLGIVSAAEMVGLLCSLVVLLVTMAFHWKYEFEGVAARHASKTWQRRLDRAGHKTGHAALLPMALLLVPVTRGSVLLRLVNVPFHKAVKYHKWLGHATLLLVMVHSAVCALYMHAVEHDLWGQIRQWNGPGAGGGAGEFNNLAGVIGTAAGAVMWVTSAPPLRRRAFEAFYAAHHLYVLFLLFTALHVGDKMLNLVLAGVFLFALDRVLRLLQSRRAVGLVAVRRLPGHAVELLLANRPGGVHYSPGSFVFLRIPAISRWQWHPFTMASSARADPDHVSVIVKAVGSKRAWTHRLAQLVPPFAPPHQHAAAAAAECDSPLTPSASLFRVSVEGPYGNEIDHFLRYENLIMVAGGSGITPFIAALKDILQRHLHRGAGTAHPAGRLPSDVTLIWAVRTPAELHTLTDTLRLPSAPSAGGAAAGLALHLHAFVTRHDRPHHHPPTPAPAAHSVWHHNPAARPQPMPRAVGRDSNRAVAAYVAVAVAAYLCLWGLAAHFYSAARPGVPAWAAALLRLAAVGVAVGMAGAGVAAVGYVREAADKGPGPAGVGEGPVKVMKMVVAEEEAVGVDVTPLLNVRYGHRPDLQGMFDEAAERLAGTHVGVMVCGPYEMQQAVARQCRKHSSVMRATSVAFHFHSESFQL